MPRNEPSHLIYMKRAIELARIALAQGESPVGSLLVRNQEIVGEGVEGVKTGKDIAAHAEMIAIRWACRALQSLDLCGCALYTTAEPCFMCSYAIRQTRISEVVLGRPSREVGGISSLHPILSDSRISCWAQPPHIVWGVLAQECEELYS